MKLNNFQKKHTAIIPWGLYPKIKGHFLQSKYAHAVEKALFSYLNGTKAAIYAGEVFRKSSAVQAVLPEPFWVAVHFSLCYTSSRMDWTTIPLQQLYSRKSLPEQADPVRRDHWII